MLFLGQQRTEPPSNLSVNEARLFREVVASSHPGHFVMTDTHLIAAYVQAVLMVRRSEQSSISRHLAEALICCCP